MLVVSVLLIKALSVIGLRVAGSKNGQAGLSDACSWAVSVQRKCQLHCWWLRLFKYLCLLSSMKLKISQNFAERGLCRFAVPLQGWLKGFCNGSSLGMKRGSFSLNHRQKECHWNDILQILLGRSSLKLPIRQWVKAAFVVCRWADFGRHCATCSDH